MAVIKYSSATRMMGKLPAMLAWVICGRFSARFNHLSRHLVRHLSRLRDAEMQNLPTQYLGANLAVWLLATRLFSLMGICGNEVLNSQRGEK